MSQFNASAMHKEFMPSTLPETGNSYIMFYITTIVIVGMVLAVLMASLYMMYKIQSKNTDIDMDKIKEAYKEANRELIQTMSDMARIEAKNKNTQIIQTDPILQNT